MQAQYCGCLKPMPFGEQVGNGKRMRQISCGEAGRFFRITCTAIIRQILSNLLGIVAELCLPEDSRGQIGKVSVSP